MGGQFSEYPLLFIEAIVSFDVKSIKSENMFGKTYGKITDMIAKEENHIGPDV